MLRAIGGSNLRANALEKGIVAAAPFAPDDTVRLTRLGFPMIANLSDTLTIPQTILTARNEFLEKSPGTAKSFLKALILGIHSPSSINPRQSKLDLKRSFKVSRSSSILHTIFTHRR